MSITTRHLLFLDFAPGPLLEGQLIDIGIQMSGTASIDVEFVSDIGEGSRLERGRPDRNLYLEGVGVHGFELDGLFLFLIIILVSIGGAVVVVGVHLLLLT
jgi:hypothetical protein